MHPSRCGLHPSLSRFAPVSVVVCTRVRRLQILHPSHIDLVFVGPTGSAAGGFDLLDEPGVFQLAESILGGPNRKPRLLRQRFQGGENAAAVVVGPVRHHQENDIRPALELGRAVDHVAHNPDAHVRSFRTLGSEAGASGGKSLSNMFMTLSRAASRPAPCAFN